MKKPFPLHAAFTASSRQILVTVASAPASAVLAVDEVILGALAGSTGTVPAFTGDCRKAFGVAIGNAEKTGAGTLRVKRWRAGTTTDENIPMTLMGDYAAVQTRLPTYARSMATTGPRSTGLPVSDWAYTGLDSFTFETTDGLTTSAPGTVSIIVGTAGTGLKGEYFDNLGCSNLKLTRTDPQVNFDWGTGTPNALIGADTFSVRWSGLLLVPETGTYTFSTLNTSQFSNVIVTP